MQIALADPLRELESCEIRVVLHPNPKIPQKSTRNQRKNILPAFQNLL